MTQYVQFLRLDAVVAMTGKSRSAIYAAVKAKTFPPPVKVGARAIAWSSTAIVAWQQACLSNSTTSPS